MAISKVIFNGDTLIDATTATAGAGDITAPKTAMLADGVMTTGSGGGIDKLIDGSITSIESNVTYIKANAFSNCASLVSASFPEATSWLGGGSGIFGGCTALASVSLPKMAGVVGIYTFTNCQSLPVVDLGSGITQLQQQSFNNCYALQALVLRRTASVVTIANVQVFSNTPFTGRNGTYSGHVYVPSSLLASYKTASNWSALFADYSDLFKTIEGSIYE